MPPTPSMNPTSMIKNYNNSLQINKDLDMQDIEFADEKMKEIMNEPEEVEEDIN